MQLNFKAKLFFFSPRYFDKQTNIPGDYLTFNMYLEYQIAR